MLHCLEMLGINLYAVNREDDTGECAGLISFLSEDDLVSKETSYKLDSSPSSGRFLPVMENIILCFTKIIV